MVTNLEYLVKTNPDLVCSSMAFHNGLAIANADNKIVLCSITNCADCKFSKLLSEDDNEGCKARRITWLKSPHEESDAELTNIRNKDGKITW